MFIPPDGPDIDERWIPEWLEYGYGQLVDYLARQAAFEDYCNRHPREGESS